jgi:ClpP class serine protease
VKHPITLAQARLEGRDPLSLFRADRALLLDPAWLARIESGAPLMFWGEDDEEDDGEGEEPCGYEMHGNVAVVDVEGPIAQRGWFCVDGYDSITASVEAALADSRAESVLLRLNSPGGAAAGAFEWTRRMRDAVVASKKRCVAYADEMAFSGAYAVACVADEIVVPETGCVGSVGVIASMVSRSKKNTMDGFDVRVIQNGAEKADGHPDLPIDPEAVAREQRSVDQLASIFHR